MSRTATRMMLKVCCAAALVLMANTPSEACLFPWLCPWGGGYGGGYGSWYGPAYPAYPAYSSPCGPGGCSPCGPGGCGVTYYGPVSACGCSPCGVGCSPCGSGCATGNCHVNLTTGSDPIPDGNRRTYSEEPEQPSTDTMPDDDFGPTNRDGASGTSTDRDPFTEPVLPMDPATDGAAPAAQPLDDEALEGVMTLKICPVRTRVHAQAQYRVPRVARLDVAPSSPWTTTPDHRRIASR